MNQRVGRTPDNETDAAVGSATDPLPWNPTPREGLPKYEALVEAIAEGIASGTLKAGTRLPPQREIARRFSTTVATVTKAIDLATRRGLVVTRTGSGTFISNSSGDDAATDAQRPGFSDLSLNSPPVAIAAPVLQHSLNTLTDSVDIQKLFGYAPIPGSQRNRRAGAAWFALRDLEVSPENILITQGAHEGLLLALMALTEPGDAVLCERLNYAGLIRIAQLLRIRLIGIDVDSEGLNTSQLARHKGDASIKAIVCTPITHNPTVATMSTARRNGLIRFAKSAGIPLIEDDIYGLLAGTGIPPLATAWQEGVIVVSSLSKSVSPGIRLGYIAAPPTLVPRVRDAMLMIGWTEPSLSACVASQLIHSGDAFQSTLLHREEASKRVALAAQILGPSMLTSHNAISYHIWVDTNQRRPTDVTAELYRMGVLVSPASHFAIDSLDTDTTLRVSLGGVASHEELRAPLELLASVLKSERPPLFGAIA